MQFQQVPSIGLQTEALTGATACGKHRRKKNFAIICGVLQICTGLMAFTVGVIETSTRLFELGITAHVGLIVTVLAGAFGIQYGRTGGKCPAIASMVLSILSSINYGAAVILYIFLLAAILPYYENYGMSYNGLNYVWEHAAASGGLMVFISIINVIASIVQSACACGMVCPCCKPTNTNVYMADQEFLQQA